MVSPPSNSMLSKSESYDRFFLWSVKLVLLRKALPQVIVIISTKSLYSHYVVAPDYNVIYIYMWVNCGWDKDLLAAATHVNVHLDLDRAGFLDHIVWRRVVWVRARGGPVHSVALWSWSLGDFRTLQGAREDEGGTPSDLNEEGEKQCNGQRLFFFFFMPSPIFGLNICNTYRYGKITDVDLDSHLRT